MHYAVSVLAAVSLVARGSDVVAPPVSLTGTWAYNAPHLALQGSSTPACNLTGLALGLNQGGSTFGGITSGSTFSCFGGVADTSRGHLSSLPILNGRIWGDSIEFDVGTPDIHSVGVVAGDSMSGVTTFTVRPTPGPIFYVGGFVAVRSK